MAQNYFGTLLENGNNISNNTHHKQFHKSSSDESTTLRGGCSPDLMDVDDEPGSEPQPGIGGEDGRSRQVSTAPAPSSHDSPLSEVDWEATFGTGAEDMEFERFMRSIDKANAGVAPTPQEASDQTVAVWSDNPDAWGPGINGEVIPEALLHLYIDIPAEFRTREYWASLVNTRKNIYISVMAQAWVNDVVRALRLPRTEPKALFGWDMVSSEWKFFFLTDPFFVPENINPQAWIGMVQHLRSSNPQEWRKSLTAPRNPHQKVEKGDPVNYVSQYVSTITTAAPILKLNPYACGPIGENLNFDRKFFTGTLPEHPELWGKCIDDGPRREGETKMLAYARVKWARINMGIMRRPPEKLIPMVNNPRKGGLGKWVLNDRTRLNRALATRNQTMAALHADKMNEHSPDFNPTYRDAWRTQQEDRRKENTRRRNAAYEHAARYYRYMKLLVPPKPTPPEDSDDDYFIDGTHPLDGESMRLSKCKPCADTGGRCSYKLQQFPCRRCVKQSTEDKCVSAQPERDKEVLSLRSLTVDGPYIPSFALLPERLEHHGPKEDIVLPAEWPTTRPAGTARMVQLLGHNRYGIVNPTGEVEVLDDEVIDDTAIEDAEIEDDGAEDTAVGESKRKATGGRDNEDGNYEPSTKKIKPTPAAKATPKAKSPPKPRAPPRARKAANPTGAKRGRKKKNEDDSSFEPCDNCKTRGEQDQCSRFRPCTNCLLNNRSHTCDSSHQNQTYTAEPAANQYGSDTIVVNHGYDYQPNYPVPGTEPPDFEDLPADTVSPYYYIEDNIMLLYDSRVILRDLPGTRLDALNDMVRAFVAQDNVLRQSDPDYRPLTTIRDSEDYFRRRLASLVDEMPHYLSEHPGDWGGSEALWEQGNPTMSMPHTPMTQEDVFREQSQQPHSAAQDLQNFHGDLAIRPINEHEQVWTYPEDVLDAANEGMDWTMTDEPAPLATANENSFDNLENFHFYSSLFNDPDDQLDPSQAEPDPMAQVTNSDITNALGMTSAFESPLTWRLENIREGYDVECSVKRTAHCTENLNFWSMNRDLHDPCPEPNGIACDVLTCDKASCKSCWTIQTGSVQFTDRAITVQTKAWFCKSCKDALDQERLRNGTTMVRLNRCHCMSQLQETRMCNVHRMEAGEAISKRASEQLTLAVQERRSARCGHCGTSAEDVTSGAWRCICCNVYVTLP